MFRFTLCRTCVNCSEGDPRQLVHPTVRATGSQRRPKRAAPFHRVRTGLRLPLSPRNPPLSTACGTATPTNIFPSFGVRTRSTTAMTERTIPTTGRAAPGGPSWLFSRGCEGARDPYITRSMNSRLRTSTGTFISSNTPRATCSDNLRNASSPFSFVARFGLPMTPLSINSWWSIGKLK